MTKQQFLSELRNKLQGLPPADIDERISFYAEMIDDRIDEGETEENAVAEIGNVDDVVMDIAKDTPLVKLVKERIKPKRRIKAWEIVLLILGFPVWFPLLVTAMVLVFVFWLLVWVMVIVTYAIEISFVGTSIGGAISFVAYFANGQINYTALGATVMCAGAAILFVFACIGATKGSIALTRRILTGIKMFFLGRKKKGDK